MNITLPYPPSANRYWRTDRGGRPHVSDEARAYKAAVGLLCRSLRLQPVAGEVDVRLDVYRPARRGDLDNSIKVLLDALKGHAYADDQQVVSINARRHEDKLDPRVEVWLEERQ